MHARCAYWLILLLVAAGCDRGAATAPAKGDDRRALETQLKQLLADRVVSARQAMMTCRAAFEAETVTLDLVIWAIDAAWKAELAAATTPAERIDAHVHHVQNLGQIKQKIEALWNVGARGGEAEKYAQAKYSVESAQIALVDHCLAAGLEYPKAAILPDSPDPPTAEP